MKIGLVGAGYVSDFYASTLPLHPELEITGVHDRCHERGDAMAERLGAVAHQTLERLLSSGDVDVVVNLTNPGSHESVTRAALEAGIHVYSEKPLASSMEAARDLAELAASRDLHLVSAPCSLLGETAQTLGQLLRRETVGTVRAVYAEMDDGMLHRMDFRSWRNSMGLPWPYRDEIAVGCTAEHAGYYLPWLVAFFGPAVEVTAFASVQVPDKVVGEDFDEVGPDLTIGCIRFESGVVARLTCSVVAPHDHSLRIMGDRGVLSVEDCWDYRSPIKSRMWRTIRRRTILTPVPRRHKLAESGAPRAKTGSVASMDYWRGVADLADAIAADRTPRLSTELGLHIQELTMAIESGGFGRGVHSMTTTCEVPEPMPWAR
ncbi:MAG: Gfo/Idh/MocA family protein [Acidimicrobiales bacterium]